MFVKLYNSIKVISLEIFFAVRNISIISSINFVSIYPLFSTICIKFSALKDNTLCHGRLMKKSFTIFISYFNTMFNPNKAPAEVL